MILRQFSKEEQQEVVHELLSLVAKHNLRTSIGAFLAIVFMFLIEYHQNINTIGLKLWLLVAVLAQINRIYILRSPLPTDFNALISRKRYYLASAFLISITYIIYFTLFFTTLSEPARCFLTLLILGLCSGSVVNNAGLRSGFVCFSIPVLATTVMFWLVTDFNSLPNGLDLLMAILIGFYGVVLDEMSKNTHKIFRETFALRFEDRIQKSLLREALKDAEIANKTKTRFLAAASHDLRQPLHTISLVSAALDLQDLKRETKNLVNLLNRVSSTLSRQLNDLLDISKLDAGIISVNLQSIDVNTVLMNIASEFELEIKEKNLKQKLELYSKNEILVDPELMYRLLRNLVHNAIKFTENGRITLKSYDEGAFVFVEVIDTGCGVDIAFQEEIFREFYQVNNEGRDRTKGFGLGLSIVARLTKLLNIEVGIDSSLNEGSNFHLKIPSNIEHNNSSIQNLNLKPNAIREKFSLNVLMIEDDELVKEAGKYLLEQLGCTCYEAISTQKAQYIASINNIDLIIADFRLGNFDNGVMAIESINQHGEIPSVLVTGDTAPDLLREIESTGLKVIHKPITFEKLHDLLKNAESIKHSRQSTHNHIKE